MIKDGKHRNIYTSYTTVEITKSGCRYTTVTVRQCIPYANYLMKSKVD